MAEKPPSSMARYAVWYVLALIMLLSVFQYYSAVQQSVEISYSEFRHLVQLKGVDDLTVSIDAITGTLLPTGIDALAKERKKPDLPQTLAKQFDKKKPTFSTVRLEDPDLVKLLAKDNINYRAVQEKTWLTSLLSWVLPLPAAHRYLGLLFPEDRRRRRRPDDRGQEQGQGLCPGRNQGHLPGRGRRGGSQRGTERDHRVLEEPRPNFRCWGAISPRGSCWWVPRAPARPCWPGPWPGRPGCPL